MNRHFTATSFVVYRDATLLHWHRSLQQWVPPGGHLLPNEDPVTGALREVLEETGLDVDLVRLTPAYKFSYPEQLLPPYTILIEDIHEPGEPHQHIDFVYFSRLRPGQGSDSLPPGRSWTWVTNDQLARNDPIERDDGSTAPVADDVRALGLAAIAAAGDGDG